jgi:hypothetical protein
VCLAVRSRERSGEVSERLKEPASKAGRPAKTGLVGSNPTLSASMAG